MPFAATFVAWTGFGHFRLFGLLDVLAVAYAITGAVVIGWRIDRPGQHRRPSISALMMTYRREWMAEFITRDPRIFNSGVLDGLRHGITFYASACIIAIGSEWAPTAHQSLAVFLRVHQRRKTARD